MKHRLVFILSTIIALTVSPLAFCQLTVSQTNVAWESDEYAAFTSLVRYKGYYVCAFREGKGHHITPTDSSTYGKIRLIRSKDAKNWKLVHTFADNSADLRDPKLSITPNNELMLIYCRREIAEGKLKPAQCDVVKFKGKKLKKTAHKPVEIGGQNSSGHWLWGVKWRKRTAYGFVYGKEFSFVKSSDGIHYEIIKGMEPFGETLTEADVIFTGNKAVAIARSSSNAALKGISEYPYNDWTWEKLDIGIGGPALFMTKNGQILLGGRNYSDETGRTTIYRLEDEGVSKVLTLPSTTDSSYPCFIETDQTIMVSFYSGRGGKSNIYISQLRFQ